MGKKPQILGSQAPPFREIQSLFAGTRFFWTEHQGIYPYRITGTSEYAGIRVLLKDAEHARTFLREIDAHVQIPKIWHAPLPSTHSVAWAAGYLAVRQHCLPAGEAFHSIFGVQPHQLPCPYHETQEINAFRKGAKHYLRTVRNIIHDNPNPKEHSNGQTTTAHVV